MSNPKCFISYSWDSDDHKQWVRKLAEQIQTHGVETLLDQWDLRPGSDAPRYMETAIRESNFVILVCTPDFARKANTGIGGVGYEKCIVTGEVFQRISAPEKFIPILKSGSEEEAIPSYLKHKIYIDFRKDQNFRNSLDELLLAVHNLPRHSRPTLGSKPQFNEQERIPRKKVIYCSICGAVPGEQSKCTSFMGHHWVSD
jgi:hypothetical protein